jgi:two-component system sensor histidine kinase GlrK
MVRTESSTLFSKQLDLKHLIEEVLEGHKVAMLFRKLELRRVLQSVKLNGDREKLRIMVDNLVSNAVKYSPNNSPLWVMLSKRGKNAIIEVADSGPGIPDAEQGRIFEAFFQGAPANKSHVRGTGLGLSIAREYAQAHGGDIAVVKSKNVGACFRVCLPLEQDT